MRNQKSNSNKGFSLVELIVVIAIMVVLIAVLAPVFTKYVEQSRRGTDISNANAIAEAVLADAADGNLASDSGTVSAGFPTAIQSTPTAQAKNLKGSGFNFVYDNSTNTVAVNVVGDSNNLTTDSGASAYKTGN